MYFLYNIFNYCVKCNKALKEQALRTLQLSLSHIHMLYYSGSQPVVSMLYWWHAKAFHGNVLIFYANGYCHLKDCYVVILTASDTPMKRLKTAALFLSTY